ncbi:MAG TPA: DUF3857 domain-containing protein [Candidatus Sulfotelmatobacter sp.]
MSFVTVCRAVFVLTIPTVFLFSPPSDCLLPGVASFAIAGFVPAQANEQGKSAESTAKTSETSGSKTSDDSADKPDYSKEAYVVEQMRGRYRFESDGTGRVENSFRIRVQSEAGVQRWGQLRFGYNSASEKLDIAYVRVLNQDGTVVTAGPEAVQDVNGSIQQVASVYTDYREKHVSVPGLRPGDVLECQSMNVIHTALAPGQFWMQHDFNQVSIVLNEELEVNVPSGRAVKVKSKPGMDPKITEENGRRIYRWTSVHLAQEDERKDKDKDKNNSNGKKKKRKKADEIPDVQMTTFASWEEVGNWYAGLERDRRTPSKEVRAKAAELTKGLNSDLDKTEALYDFAAKNFRYVSLSLGLARYQPAAAGEVLHNQYGDCKDKNTLLAALLEAEGLHSSTVLINSFRKLDPDIPSPSQFSHNGMKVDDLIKSGNEARKNGNYALAIDLFNRAIADDPKTKLAWNDLGIVYMNDQQDGLAINAFQKQIEVNLYDLNAYNNLGRVYLRERKYDEAEKWFNKQIEIQPLDKYAHENLGIAYLERRKYQDAVPELEKAASLTPDNAEAQVRIGEAYLNLGQDEKAMAAFDKAVKISATPPTWNSIAYQLALKNAHLELAQRYAESAISTTASRLRNLSLDQLKQTDLGLTSALGSFWDTLGWVAFAKGDLEKAKTYVTAAWELGQVGDEGDHLGQICEKKGDKEGAAHWYALALSTRRPELETRNRLAALVGGDDKVDVMVAKYRDELQRWRTVQVTSAVKQDGSADFFVLLNGGQAAGAVVEDAKFIKGNDGLKGIADALRASKYKQRVPDEAPVKLLRRGTISCRSMSGACSLDLDLPADVKSVD